MLKKKTNHELEKQHNNNNNNRKKYDDFIITNFKNKTIEKKRCYIHLTKKQKYILVKELNRKTKKNIFFI